MAANRNALGDHLRARRGQVRPEEVGLVAGARRRVQDLRREELATLAGISSDYYLRLEQGRDKKPSTQILDALARALQLDVKATEYLHQLASPTGGRRDHGSVEAAADGSAELIEQFAMPAIVASRCLDVLAANSIACALSPVLPSARTFCAGGCWTLPPAGGVGKNPETAPPQVLLRTVSRAPRSRRSTAN